MLIDFNVVPGDKVSMDKVLLVGTATETKLGQPLVENAYVEVVVEQQTLSDKVAPLRVSRLVSAFP